MKIDFVDMIKTIIIIVLVILLLLMKRCTDGIEPGDSTIDHYSDTTYVTHIDTIEFRHDTTITKTKLSYTYVYIAKADSSKIYTFKNHISDSLITGDITTRVKVKDSIATLLNQDLTYVPKFPKYIHQIDSVFIKDSTVVTLYDTKPKLLIGLGLMIPTDGDQGTIIPNIGLELKGNTIIEAGYDPFNKQFMVGAKYKLRFKKRN